MRVAIGADHGGFELKQHLVRWLGARGHEVIDCGTHDTSAVDYPVIARAVAAKVVTGECTRGIVIDGAGIGSSMAANKVAGIRAALCYDLSSAKNSREHNDANVLTLGARLIGPGLAEQVADVFLTTECTEERHQQRVAMIELAASSACTAGTGCACGAGGSGVAVPGAASAGGGRSAVGEKASQPSANGASGCAACAAQSVGAAQKQTLAERAARHDSAPAYDGANKAFRASSAEWLAGSGRGPSASRPSLGQVSTPPSPMTLAALHPADLERVATRLAELLASAETRHGMVCFGDVCLDASVAKQWIGFGVSRLSTSLGQAGAVRDVGSYIDHTLLKQDATDAQVRQLCAEAREHGFFSVCVNPCWVKLCAGLLNGGSVAKGRSPSKGGGGVKVCTVVGFPLGANVPEQKALEARRAIRDGAAEIDMVINIGALKSGDDALVYKDIRGVIEACDDGGALSKVIIETALLTDEEKVRACVLSKRARADFVKTSTGFAGGGATAADVALMHRAVGGTLGVKASGGVKNYADFEAMVSAGATRVGASASIKILKEAAAR
ncbi:MAG: deoxyribose-phosphate aldolase [Myxococcales bacterium]|nr:deoxyribose-phosphate aldolase [Myxococcales bacterium]